MTDLEQAAYNYANARHAYKGAYEAGLPFSVLQTFTEEGDLTLKELIQAALDFYADSIDGSIE